MEDVAARQFGLVIAYFLPGLVMLVGLAGIYPDLGAWLTESGGAEPSIGAFLFVASGSLTCGMLLSTVRWLTVDLLHHATGLTPPVWNDRRLSENLPAFESLVDNHFRYYQWHAHTLLALPMAWWGWFTAIDFEAGSHLLTVIVALILFLGSRDTLAKYYRRTARLLSTERIDDHDQRTQTRPEAHD